jgi:hypothetical protein
MRTCPDAKAMAKSLRTCLAAQKVVLSHGQCLEIVAKQFGFADWNTLAARMLPATAPEQHKACSFCGKSQYVVRGLIEGDCPRARRMPGVRPSQENCVFICDECVRFSAQIIADLLGNARDAR